MHRDVRRIERRHRYAPDRNQDETVPTRADNCSRTPNCDNGDPEAFSKNASLSYQATRLDPSELLKCTALHPYSEKTIPCRPEETASRRMFHFGRQRRRSPPVGLFYIAPANPSWPKHDFHSRVVSGTPPRSSCRSC